MVPLVAPSRMPFPSVGSLQREKNNNSPSKIVRERENEKLMAKKQKERNPRDYSL